MVKDDVWAETWMLKRRPAAVLRFLERTFWAEGSVFKDGFGQFLPFLQGHPTPTPEAESFFPALADEGMCPSQVCPSRSLITLAFPLWSQLSFKKKFNYIETAMLLRQPSYQEGLHRTTSGWRLHQLSNPTQWNATKWVNTTDKEEKDHPGEASQPTEL